jgi:hypothetical protein
MFVGVKINFLHILSSLNLSEVTSKFRTLATFVSADLQTVFYTYCVRMFMICLPASLRVPSPVAVVVSQFVHCLKFSNMFEHIVYQNLPQLLFPNIVVQVYIFVRFLAINIP